MTTQGKRPQNPAAQGYVTKFSGARLPIAIGVVSILALLAGFGTWAAFTEIDGAVVAGGTVIVDRNRQAVQHLDGGVVNAVLVSEGQRVAAGDVLVRLDPTVASTELHGLDGQLAEVLARRGRLEAERDDAPDIRFEPMLVKASATDPNIARYVEGQTRLFTMRREGLEQELAQLNVQQTQLHNQIAGIEAQLTALERQTRLITEEVAIQSELLDKGLAQAARVRTLEREEARLAGLVGQMIASRAEAMEQISELSIQMLRLKMQRRQEALTTLRDLEMTELQLSQQREVLQTRLTRMDIRAPVSGVVYDLRILGPQSVIRPAEPMMFIVPQDRPMMIEVRVRPINVNAVHVRQEVVVRFPAFDMRQTPDLIGRVSMVSPDAFVDSGSGEPYYRAEVELAEHELSKLGGDQIIMPGMPVDSFIRTGEHTPLAYLLAPLARYFDAAMRDNS